MAKVWIMGAGGFGVALAVMCANNGHQVTAYSPFQEEIETLQRDREPGNCRSGLRQIWLFWQRRLSLSARPARPFPESWIGIQLCPVLQKDSIKIPWKP